MQSAFTDCFAKPKFQQQKMNPRINSDFGKLRRKVLREREREREETCLERKIIRVPWYSAANSS